MDMDPESKGFESRIGPIEVNWPQTVGYYGGIALALAFEVIEPPVGLFIAAVPLLKMLSRPKAPQPVRLVSQVFVGAAKPVGGDAESTVRIAENNGQSGGNNKTAKPQPNRAAKSLENKAKTAAGK
ncbi:MAG TPA: hypothetical protein VKT52_05240 [Ktedonobacterales bacterium]|nr:hypothetical protein [Ktedonobacterales bacterium]